jgi:hypothetical protein
VGNGRILNQDRGLPPLFSNLDQGNEREFLDHSARKQRLRVQVRNTAARAEIANLSD